MRPMPPTRRACRMTAVLFSAASICALSGGDSRADQPTGKVAPASARPAASSILERKNSGFKLPVPDPKRKKPAPTADPTEIIDRYFEACWKEQKVEPGPPADDAAFLRRVSLDLIGIIPTAAEARAFLDDKNPGKRVAKVDELLKHPRFADFWALKIRDMISETAAVDGQGVSTLALFNYLRESLQRNRPWDAMSRDMIAGSGWNRLDGAVNYISLFEGKAPELATATGRMFMGVNTQCAQCHDHPYTQMTQRDFWGLAAFFARTNSRFNADDMFLRKSGAAVAHVVPVETQLPGGWGAILGDNGEAREVYDNPRGEVTMPFVDDPKPIPPTYLGGEPMVDPERDRRNALAEWITRPDNPYFARNVVNRLWLHFTGDTFVKPVDAFADIQTPEHADLLEDLGGHFTTGRFYLKPLMRGMVLSRVYQLAAAADTRQPRHYAAARRRPLDPDQWHDSVLRATELVEGLQHPPVDRRRKKDASAAAGEPQARLAADGGGQAAKKSPPPYQPPNIAGMLKRTRSEARQVEGPTARALLRLNGKLINDGIQRGDRYETIRNLDQPDQRLEELYLSTLSRRPTDAEQTRDLPVISGADPADADAALADLFWVLLNSTEFETR